MVIVQQQCTMDNPSEPDSFIHYHSISMYVPSFYVETKLETKNNLPVKTLRPITYFLHS